MYVCICGSVTEDQIKKAVQGGCECLSDVQEELFVAYCCKTCQPEAERLIEESALLPTS